MRSFLVEAVLDDGGDAIGVKRISFVTTQVFRLKAVHFLARHASSHSTPSRFLRPWVQAEMNHSMQAED
jgi:hypothetical protein